MKKAIAGALLVSTSLLISQFASAGVYMCEDPVTGKKTFTDRACPTSDQPGKKVRVEPTNFGQGSATRNKGGTWNSQQDTSVAGRDNLSGNARRISAANNAGAPVSGD